MNGRLLSWGMAAGLLCTSATASFGADVLVQEFDGWKITIRPGASSLPDPVPPSPRIYETTAESSQGRIQLVSLRQEAVVPAPVTASPPSETAAAKDGLPVIIPGESSQCCDTTPTVHPPEGTVDPRYLSQMYTEIYRSIPFNRAEYNANPSYRHDTAVEFLFGKMRPTVIHRGTTTVNHHYPSGYGMPFGYGGRGYAYPLQLIVPGVGLQISRSYYSN
ncbi:MAG: hypothetical protein JSS49_18145 [Planctomycetes bacterium]|nr:hypothetical protein [Planctomycetota bacterium]